MSVQPLFTPLRMRDLDLPNRIVMAVELYLNRDRQKPGGLLTVVAMQCLAGQWRKKRN
jgi:2,4-dienoyl-CoA reductase-like NADH-dependent reductase (Old Yellow Enzyme family)